MWMGRPTCSLQPPQRGSGPARRQGVTLGGKWRGRVHPDHANRAFLAVLQLFCGMLIFNGSCCWHVRRIARDVRAGRYEPKIEKQEADLYMNPRRVR